MTTWLNGSGFACIVASATLLIQSPAFAAANTWHRYNDAPSDIAVQYRQLDRGHIEIRAEREVQSSIGAFLHLLENVDAVHTWVNRAKSAVILARPSSTEFIVHTEFHGAFIIADRSMVTASEWHQDPQTYQLTLNVRDASSEYAVDTDSVMLQDVSASWQLTPGAKGWLTISYVGSAHPGGHVPMFLAKRQALKSIVQTFKNLPEALAEHQKPYPNVNEPAQQN